MQIRRPQKDSHPIALAALLLTAAVAPTPARAGEGSAEPSDRPNVLFIAVDDLRPELGCYGNDRVHSPNIDRLAKRGVVFQRAYCQQAVCSPSRTSLLTGLRPDSTKVYDLRTHFRDTVPDVVTLPQHFKKHGYHTVGMGKIYHGSLNDEKSWSEPWWRPTGRSPRGYVLDENIKIAEGNRNRGPAVEAADVPDDAYPDGMLADRAVQTLREMEGRDEPFFLAVGFVKPHLPFNAPEKYWDRYDRTQIELPDRTAPPQGAPRYATTNWGELRNYHGIPEQGGLSEDQARRLIHGYFACVTYIDAQIGKLLDELDSLGLTDNTIVILWGDHGWKLGEYGDWSKHTNFELDTRVPLILSDPRGGSKGRASDALVELVDIYPTLCELAGLPLPEHLEGVSMVPLLRDPDRPWKSAAFSQYPRGRIMGYSMRTDRYRLTRWQRRDDPERVKAVELYDHQSDPGETRNIADHPENAKLVKKLTARLEAGWRAALPERD